MVRILPTALLLAGTALCRPAPAQDAPAGGAAIDVRRHGAIGDGATLDTEALQAAIDSCASRGGGEVVLPPGLYLTGTLVLRSHVVLNLMAGATLLASTNLEDYPAHVPAYRSYTDSYTVRSLLYAERIENAGLVGKGLVDGRGKAFPGAYKVRPYLMRFVECRGLTIRDVRMRRSAMWTLHLLACEDVVVDGIDLVTLPPVNYNNDGIDIDSSRRVRIANCRVRTQDDAIVLKSTSPRPCEDVTITNCVLSSTCNAFKLGTESVGGFRNITLSNCAIHDTRLAGIALELVDGGVLEGVNINNVVMRGVAGAALFMRLGNRARPWWIARPGDPPGAEPPPPGMGRMRDISISNVQASGMGTTGCAISGLPGHPIRNLTLTGIRLRFRGGASREAAERLEIPEKERSYPEYSMFGTLPAYGLYIRHVETMRLRDVDLSFEKEDARPPLLCEDVQGLDLLALSAQVGRKADCWVRLLGVRNALIHACRARGRPAHIAMLDERCRGIRWEANAFAPPGRDEGDG